MMISSKRLDQDPHIRRPKTVFKKKYKDKLKKKVDIAKKYNHNKIYHLTNNKILDFKD